jgi:hypothetical protein
MFMARDEKISNTMLNVVNIGTSSNRVATLGEQEPSFSFVM